MELQTIPERIRYDPILGKTWYDVHKQDLNAFLIFVGKPGSRKSGSAGTIGFELDPTFNIGRCVWLGSELLDLIEKGEKINGRYRELKKGSVILWDETGVEGDNTEWYSQKAKVIKHVFTLSRYRNLIVLMTTTSVGAVQIGVRRLLHGIFRMKGVPGDKDYPSDKFAEARFYWYHENFTDSKPRFTNPRYQYWQGDYSRLDRIFIPRPPKDWEDAYKVRKDHYARNWVSLFSNDLKRLEPLLSSNPNKKIEPTIDVIARADKEIRENLKKYVLYRYEGSDPKVSAGLIQEDYKELSKTDSANLAAKLNALIAARRLQVPSV
jgi:hypothetical protein